MASLSVVLKHPLYAENGLTFARPSSTGVNDGARTRDIRLHKPALYQLSYAHHVLSTFSRAQRDQVYYNQRENFSTTSVDVAIT